MNTTFRALSSPAFRFLLLTSFISNVGTAVQEVAQGWLVLELTGSAVWLGVVAACARAPFVVMAPIGGVLADRYNRRALLGLAKVIQVVPAVTLAVIVPLGLARPWHFVVAALLLGLGDALGLPTTAALQRDLVNKEDLRSAIAVQVGQYHFARSLGPVLASGVFAIVGVAYAFSVDAASYLPLLLFCFAGWRSAPVAPKTASPRVLTAFREGVHYANKDARLRLLLIASVMVGALFLTYPALFPVIAKHFDAGPSGIAYLAAATSVGAFAGALLMPTIVGTRNWVVVLGVLALAAALGQLALGWAPTLWSACAFTAIARLASTAYVTLTASTLQLLATGEFQGRVMSLHFFAVNLGLVVGSLGLGAVAGGSTDMFVPLAVVSGAGVVHAIWLLARSR